MKYQWRITKYNPLFRNNKGHYLLDEWTCPSEIGKIINGDSFTLEDYLLIEHAYVETIIEFLNEKRQYSLRLIQTSNRSISHEDKTSILYDNEFGMINIKEDLIVNINEIRIICKMILRNFADCQLFSKDNFFVHFGWDYYMYIGSSQKSLTAIEFAKKNGLYVEEFISPYYFEEKDTKRLVQWSEVGVEIPLVIGDEEIVNVPLEEYRKIFDLSEEHPVFGYFEITEDYRDYFQIFLNHKMDFTKYEYGLWAGN
ncbi:DUF7683 domain-containing protein [Paenibacillus sp. Soil522]|uniref:DUF7683 domain-containing protein n=1 Tax=Paenibacillus sp. Soil522 TaxID=1736388 RepID=UPI0006FAEF6A|nr:hypothetical protein [Paenibacillus sp. Soil522]KRE49915.1 hypothetical protein ASG81_03850 [Paenibacillus sp. Soil522]